MKVYLASAFRNSSRYLDRYFTQVAHLQELLNEQGHELYCLWGEGDSTDATHARLLKSPLQAAVIDCTHNGPLFGSVVHPERFRQLAHVASRIWQAIPAAAETFLWVESDLIWDAGTMLNLLSRLQELPAVVPMVMLHRQGWPNDAFYDIFAFRKAGINFKHLPPYHPQWQQMMQVDSAGSCMAIRAELARQIKWDQGVFPSACQQIYKAGGSIWLDTSLQVIHE